MHHGVRGHGPGADVDGGTEVAATGLAGRRPLTRAATDASSPSSEAPASRRRRARPDIPEPEPPSRPTDRPAIIAMVNQKGGVGKTTSTISLGAALAGYGRRVLLVDFDPQGALSRGLGINPTSSTSRSTTC